MYGLAHVSSHQRHNFETVDEIVQGQCEFSFPLITLITEDLLKKWPGSATLIHIVLFYEFPY